METKPDKPAAPIYSDPSLNEHFDMLDEETQNAIIEYEQKFQEEILASMMDPEIAEALGTLPDSEKKVFEKKINSMTLLEQARALNALKKRYARKHESEAIEIVYSDESDDSADAVDSAKTVNFDDMEVEDREEDVATSVPRDKRTRSFLEEAEPRVRPRHDSAETANPMRETGRPSFIYSPGLITKSVSIEMKYIGSNIKEVLETKLRNVPCSRVKHFVPPTF
jgi:hypothetical protein